MPNASFSQYRQSQMSSNAPEKTVLMLYDGAVRFLRAAIREIDENNNISEKANLVEKTVKIIEYLQSCLDNEKGGEISVNLNRLYDYMSVRLTRANLNNDTEKMNEVLNLLLTIRDGWNNICDKGKGSLELPAVPSQKNAGTNANNDVTSHTEGKVGIRV